MAFRRLKRMGRAIKKGAKATGKGLRKGLTAVHNVTHKGPIGKARNAVAGMVKKIPVAKQFVEIGEFSSAQIHKGLKKAKVLGKGAAEPLKKKANTSVLTRAAAGMADGKVKNLTTVAMTASPVVQEKMRRTGALTAPKAKVAKAARAAAKKLAAAAKSGSKSAKKGLALAAAASAVAKGKPAKQVREILKDGGALAGKGTKKGAKKGAKKGTKGVTYEVRNLSTGKVTRVEL